MNVTVLVDFENDSARTAVEVADALGDELWGVRLDTSERLVDAGLRASTGPTRRAASPPSSSSWSAGRSTRAGHGRVRIVVSGGFDAERIAAFEERRRAGRRLRRRLVAAPRGRTTSRPTSSGSTGAPAPRSGARSARTRASSSSLRRPRSRGGPGSVAADAAAPEVLRAREGNLERGRVRRCALHAVGAAEQLCLVARKRREVRRVGGGQRQPQAVALGDLGEGGEDLDVEAGDLCRSGPASATSR